MKRKIVRLVGATVVSATLLGIPVGLATAEGPPVTVQIYGNAFLQSDGSAIVTITYSCLGGFGSNGTGSISGTLEQSQGFGAVAATAICDDQNHTTTLDMAPGQFSLGEAAANITVGTGVNEQGTAQAEVQIQPHH